MSAATGTNSLSMGRVALTVADLDQVRTFYEKVVGLDLLRSDGEGAEFGSGGEVLLELRRDGAARRRSPREAGLFHTAFLLPSRGHLGRWVRHALDSGSPIGGASDHLVSEALYLSDPEGNGVEIYADRPRGEWTRRNGEIAMSTDRLDIDDLLRHAEADAWTGMPKGTAIGHVHLQVGALAPAEEFYAGLLGLDITTRYPGATFYAADGYHHHVATNIWNSRKAPERTFPSTGLADVEIRAPGAVIEAVERRLGPPAASIRRGTGLLLKDPWGTSITLSRFEA